MNATLDAEELKRLRRLARTAIVLAAVSTAVAVAALVVAYNTAPYEPPERAQVTSEPTPTPSRPLSASVVEAERFVLRGKAGQVRAELGVEPDQRAELSLRGPDGTLRAVLATADSSNPEKASLLGLCDQKGKRLAALSVLNVSKIPSMPQLTMAGSAGRTRLSLNVTNDQPTLDLLDTEEHARASLAIVNDAPFLAMMDEEHNVRVALGYFYRFIGRFIGNEVPVGPALSLSDQKGHVRATLGSTELVTVKTGSSERTAESSLVLFDQENKVIFQAPPR